MSDIKLELPVSGGGTPYSLNIEDEGSVQVSNPSAINFVGAGVSVWENPIGTAEVTIPEGNNVIDVRDNGILAQNNPSYIDFTGGGVSAIGFMGGVSVNIPDFDIRDEGVSIIRSGNANAMNFTGAGVTVTENLGVANISIPGSTPYALDIDDEGAAVVSNPSAINFVGAGVSVIENPSGTAEVTIGGGTPYALDVEDEGATVVSNPSAINFVGSGVSVVENPSGIAEVTIASGGLQYWDESEDATTQQSTIFTPNNAATNVNAVLLPKGNGANIAQTPDGTSTGGNARGQYATDWQKRRNAANEVASGNDSTISGGRNNTASGTDSSVSGGRNNTASGTDSSVSGGRDNTASGNDSFSSGATNVASGLRSAILGGLSNTASGTYSVVTGGTLNTATTTNTRAAGYSGRADRTNSDVWAWQRVNMQGVDPVNVQHIKIGGSYDLGVLGSGGGTRTAADLVVSQTDVNLNLDLKLTLINRGNSFMGSFGALAAFQCSFAIRRISGVTSLVGTPVVNDLFSDWTVTPSLSFSVSGTTLDISAIIPSGFGNQGVVHSVYVYEGLEVRYP